MNGVVVVFLLASQAEPANPTAEAAIATSARDALGQSSVEVRALESFPTDADAIRAGSRAHARAVAEVSWLDAGHLHARVRVHAARGTTWEERDLGFGPADAARERDRAVALALVSMLPEEQPASPPASRVGVAATHEPRAEATSTNWGDDTPPRAAPDRVVTAPPPIPRASLELAGLGRTDFDDSSATGVGMGGRFRFTRTLELRLGGSLRDMSGPGIYHGSRLVSGGVGLAWSVALPWLPNVMVGARGDVLVLREPATRLATDDLTAGTRARWLPGADLLVEAGWWLTPSAGFFLAAGAEAAFGPTSSSLDAPTIAFAVVRGVGELGIRVRF